MADSLQFSVGADTAGFNSAFDGVIGKIAALAAAFISVQSVIEAFGRAIELGGRLHDLSTRTGETAGNLAILERAFDNTNIGADKLGPAISKMQVGITALATDSEACKNAFTQLGLTFADLNGKAPIEQLQLIGARLAAIEDPTLRAATAAGIFGERIGPKLLPFLLAFNKETAEARTQLGSLPAVLDATASKVDSLGDNLSAIKNKSTELAYGFLSEVVPAVEKFTSRLAGVDAASIGAGLADALIGAFVKPMAAAELLGSALALAAKTMGNELIYAITYGAQLLFNTFQELGFSIIPMIGNNMAAMFEGAVGTLGVVLTDTLVGVMEGMRGLLEPMGFGDELNTAITAVLGVGNDFSLLVTNAADKITTSSEAFSAAFEKAKSSTTVIRQDVFGAAQESERIAELWKDIQKTGKEALAGFDLTTGLPTLGSGDHLTPEQRAFLEGADKVQQQSVLSSGGGGGGMTEQQLLAAIKKTLDLVAGANPDQAIGQSASAKKALELRKEIDTLLAKGVDTQGEQNKLAALQASLQLHENIAVGATLTAQDRDAARQWAYEHMNDDWAKGMTTQQLIDMAEQNIIENKVAKANMSPEQKTAEAKKAAESQDQKAAQQTPQMMFSEMLSLFRKVEPRIPQHILS